MPSLDPLGSRLPLSRFASPLPRCCRTAACLLAAVVLFPGHTLLRAQQVPSGSPETVLGAATTVLGSAAAERARTAAFLRTRQTAAGGPDSHSGHPNQHSTAPNTRGSADALQHARALHAAMLRQRTAASAQNAATAQTAATASLSVAWTPVGPGSVTSMTYGALTGRITALALDPNDPTANTLYVGSTGGGVWKSTNAAGPLGSVTLTPLTDDLPVFNGGAGSAALASLSIGALAVEPAPNPVLLAGTGDPNSASDSYYGSGILRSVDGGQTWTLATGSNDGPNGRHSFTGLATAAIAFSTATPMLAVAAISTSREGTVVEAAGASSVPGLYYSADAGATWQMATVYDGGSLVQQPLSGVEAGNAATAVVWNAARQKFIAALRYHGLYESADGATWTRLASQPGTGVTLAACPTLTNSTCPFFRAALAVQPVSGDTYALSVTSTNGDNGLWQDLCVATGNGACTAAQPAFARIDLGALDTPTGSGTIGQGSYNLALLAAPSGSAASAGTSLFAGTLDLYRCTLSATSPACTLRNTTNATDGCNAPAAVAPAQHALAAATLNGTPALWLGNDGGLWRSLDGVAETGSVCAASDSTHFDNLNTALGNLATGGGSLAEVVGFASHPAENGTLLAGIGALGTAGISSASGTQPVTTAWTQLSAGEGGQPLIDSTSPANRYITLGAGIDVRACTLGDACGPADFASPATIGSGQVGGDVALLHAPLLLDPANTASLLLGTCRLWRGPAASGAAWTANNALGLPPAASAPCTATSNLLRAVGAGGPVTTGADAAHTGSSVLYAGAAGALDGGTTSQGGHIFLLKSATAVTPSTPLTDLAGSPVTNSTAAFNAFGFDVTAVLVDAHDPKGATVYATIGGLAAGNVPPHVYRSVDFGAHWTNISANLPSAPANALAVDPNNANTVYVAMDTGIYVTSAVTTCATTNCWSVFGASLPNAPAVSLDAEPNLLTGDGRRGLLRVGTYGRGIWQQPLLNAISLAVPAFTLAPASLAFAAQQVSTQSAAQTVTLTSTGNSPVTISSVTVTTGYTESDTCSGQTIAVNGTCTLSVVFAPVATGATGGTLTVFANTAGGQQTVSLTGTATAPPAVVFTPAALSFAATIVNQTAATQLINVANTGGTPATLAAPVLNGDFALANTTCGTTLAPQTACALGVSFTPTAAGTRNGTLTLSDSAGTQTATLTGMGTAAATDTLSASQLTFALTTVGSTSAAQQVTITNTGGNALTLITAAASGPFTVVNGCGASLAAGSTCALTVAFVPVAAGAASGTLTITDQFRLQTVALTGTGAAPPGVSLTPATLAFAATGVGLTAPAQSVTLTNNGGTVLTLRAMTASGDFSLASTTCGASVAVGASCTLAIAFTPTVAGTRNGALTLSDDAPGGSQTVSLSGSAVDFALVPSSPTTATLMSGGTATYGLLLNSMPLNASAAMTCTGAPAHARCTVSPATPTLSGSVALTVSVGTGLTTLVRTASLSTGPAPRSRLPWIGFASLVLWLLPSRRRRQRLRNALSAALLITLAAGSLTLLSGCGSGRTLVQTGAGTTASTPTPSGTYTLTVTASSTGLTRSQQLTLIVQ